MIEKSQIQDGGRSRKTISERKWHHFKLITSPLFVSFQIRHWRYILRWKNGPDSMYNSKVYRNKKYLRSQGSCPCVIILWGRKFQTTSTWCVDWSSTWSELRIASNMSATGILLSSIEVHSLLLMKHFMEELAAWERTWTAVTDRITAANMSCKIFPKTNPTTYQVFLNPPHPNNRINL